MKKLKKIFILSLIFIQIALSSICFGGCVLDDFAISCAGKLVSIFEMREPFYENEYFIYSIRNIKPGKRVHIYGLTDLGKQQKYLVIPKTIDGIPVSSMACRYRDAEAVKEKYGEEHVDFQSDTIEKIFIPEDITIWYNSLPYLTCFDKCPNLKKVLYLSSTDGVCSCNHVHQRTYSCHFAGYTANVSYLYNYDNAPNNNYYWADDYDGTIIEYIPPDPVRDGFVFDGWYKEAECLNLWNFDTEYIYYEYDENGIYIDKITNLYAKWTKI